MKTIFLFFVSFCISMMVQAQVFKTANVTPGHLRVVLTAEELATITNLTLTGTMDARDFKTMRDDMPILAEIDLSGVTVAEYTGSGGTSNNMGTNTIYPVNAIPENAFVINNSGGKLGLTSFIFPPNTTSIGTSAFFHTGLTSVSIPPTITMIGTCAFADCSFQTPINIPASVTTLGFMAFRGSSVNVDVNNPKYSSIDGVLFNKSQTKLIAYPKSRMGDYVLPSTVIEIAESAFEECYDLTSVSLPYSLTSIGERAFFACGKITSLNIPSSVIHIGGGAFSYCGLTSIHMNACNPIKFYSDSWVFIWFDKTACILSVPYGTASKYASAREWKDFDIIVEASNGLNVSSNNVTIGSAGGSIATIDVTANVDWAASTDQSWLTVNPVAGNNNIILTFTAEAYSSIGSRKAIVTVSGAGIDAQTIIVTQSGSDAPINITAGGLATTLTVDQLASITKLTLTGTIDARDFKTMRDDMPLLSEIDLSGVKIAAYNGLEGTSIQSSTNYLANVIPEYAFTDFGWNGKESLKNIVFPKSIIKIDKFAFNNCFNLELINIPEGVKTIGEQSFVGCTGALSIFIPASATTFEPSALMRFGGIFNVDEKNPNYSSSDGVLFNKNKTTLMVYPSTKIGGYSIPSSVNTIGYSAFNSCINLTSVFIPTSVTYIENGAFCGCLGLTSVTLPSSITTIDNTAFGGCANLISIYTRPKYPVNLNQINSQYVFQAIDFTKCTLYVPSGSKELYAAADQWKDFENIEEVSFVEISSNNLNILNPEGATAKVNINSDLTWIASSDHIWLSAIPSSGTGKQSLVFTANANPSILPRTAKVTISATGADSQTITVTQAASPTKKVTAGNLKNVLSEEELSSATKIILTGTIDARDFKTMRDEMPYQTEIDMRGVKIVEYNGLEGTADTHNTFYPENEVPYYAFFNVNSGQSKVNLQSLKLPASVTSIGRYAFYGCVGLTSIHIPSLVNFIDEFAFWNISGTFSVENGNSNFSSLYGVLFNKTQSKLIQCPTSKTGIYDIPSTVSYINEGAFIGCKSLTSVSIPSSVISIPNDVFFGCESLMSVGIPSSIEFIGVSAFSGTGLDSVSIPSSVSFIGSWAFSGSTRLKSIYCSAIIPIDLSSSQDVFDSVDKSTCKLFVPYMTKNLYAAANQWKDFIHIIEATEGFMIDKSFLLIQGDEGSSANANLISNVDWTASSDQEWLSINQTTGNSDKSLVFTAKSNNSIASRSAKVTVTSTGGSSQTITIIQEGMIPVITVPIANYPLLNDGLDVTGNNGEMTLKNTQFQNGGLLCNGIYDLSGQPNSYKALTPSIKNFNLNSFLVSVDFLVDQYKDQPVLVLGACRLLGFYLKADSTIDLYYNNIRYLTSTKKYTLNEWHNAKISYDGVTAKIFLDNDLACFINTKLENPCGDYSNEICPTNYGNGEALAGYIKNIKVYSCSAPECKFSATSANLAAKQGSTATVNVISNTTWSVCSDQLWLKVNQSSATGNQILTFTADGNPVNEERTAIVTISAPGADSQTIIVTQNNWAVGLNVLSENPTQFQCYPNPFTDEITIEIHNQKQAEISVDIYNLAGERIKNFAINRNDEQLDLKWNGTNDSGIKVAPGVYVCKVNNLSKQMIYQGSKGKN